MSESPQPTARMSALLHLCKLDTEIRRIAQNWATQQAIDHHILDLPSSRALAGDGTLKYSETSTPGPLYMV